MEYFGQMYVVFCITEYFQTINFILMDLS